MKLDSVFPDLESKSVGHALRTKFQACSTTQISPILSDNLDKLYIW